VVSQYGVRPPHIASLVHAVVIAPLDEPLAPDDPAPLEVEAPELEEEEDDPPPSSVAPPEAPDEVPPPDAPEEPPSPEFPLSVVLLPPQPIPITMAKLTPTRTLEAFMRIPSGKAPLCG
jgi:hypothetical protein